MNKKLLYVSFIVFLFVILLNIPSFATFYINDFQIDANLDSKGDMEVREKITYYTDEVTNGLTRKIITENQLNKNNSASGLELKDVYVDGKTCDNVSYANIGDNLVYEYRTDGSNEYNIKLYSPFISDVKTVEYDYILSNVAVRYNDIAELYWNFIGDEWDCGIENLTINITLPELASRSTSYVYGHGSDNGSFTKSANKITLYARNLNAYQALDARILFKKEAISDSPKSINKNVLEKYINEEEGFYKNQEEKKAIGNLSVRNIAEILSLIILFTWFATYILFDKEYSVDEGKYVREIPFDLSPEMLQYIYYGKIKKNSFYIGFLNLIKKGVFKIEERTNKVGKKVQTIIYNKNENQELTEPEEIIRDTIRSFLKNNPEKDDESMDILTLSEKMGRTTGQGYKRYSENLEDIKESFFGKPSKAPKNILIVASIAMIALVAIITMTAFSVNQTGYIDDVFVIPVFLGIITICYSFAFASAGSLIPVLLFLIFHCGAFQVGCFFILKSAGVEWLFIPYILLFVYIQYLVRIKKYSIEERQAIAKIKGLRRYIRDYSMLNEKEELMGNIALWEDYFIIAIALGLNKKTINYFYNYGKEQLGSNLGNSMHYSESYIDFHYPIYNSFYSYQRSYSSYTGNSSGGSSSGGSSFSGSSGGFSGGSSSGGGGGRRWRRQPFLKMNINRKNVKNTFMKSKGVFLYLIIGIIAGIISGFLGSGGGMILVPIFSHILGLNEIKSRASTIFCITFMVITSSIFYINKNAIDLNLGIKCSIGGIVGAFIGSKLLMNIKGKYLEILFILFLIYSGVKMMI